MNEVAENTNSMKNDASADGLKSHAFAIALFVVTLAALPAYLAAMEGQFIDMEFLASLCGISGWGSN